MFLFSTGIQTNSLIRHHSAGEMIPQSSSSSSTSALGSNFLNPAPIEHQNSAPSLSTTTRNKKMIKKIVLVV